MNKWLRRFLLGALLGAGSSIFAQELSSRSDGVSSWQKDTLHASSIDDESYLVTEENPSELWELKEGDGRCVSLKDIPGEFFVRMEAGRLRLYKVTSDSKRHLMNQGGNLSLVIKLCPMYREKNELARQAPSML